MRGMIGCTTLLVLLLAALQGTPVQAFVKVVNGSFVDSDTCQELVFSGWNTWGLIDDYLGQGDIQPGGASYVTSQLDEGVAANLTLMRMYGHASSCNVQMQTSPGVYNETVLRAMDFVVAETTKRGVYMSITFGNNWWTVGCNASDTRAWYTNFSSTAKSPDDFYSDNQTLTFYKNHIAYILNRNNTITGRKYKDEPRIGMWNLMNEPRCDAANCSSKMLSWVQIMADYFKTQNTNQLISVGEEGFYDASSCLAATVNPDTWAGQQGQDFLPHYAVASIDYASFHLWPNNWARTDLPFTQAWITNHTLNARQLGKPLLLEEMGASFNMTAANAGGLNQTSFYQLAYSLVEKSIDSGDYLKGVAFWRYIDDNKMNDEYAVDANSSSWLNVILPFSKRVTQLQRNKVAGCVPPSSAGAPSSSVAIASITASNSTSTLPGPDAFLRPDPNGLNKTCYAFSGSVAGTTTSTSTTAG